MLLLSSDYAAFDVLREAGEFGTVTGLAVTPANWERPPRQRTLRGVVYGGESCSVVTHGRSVYTAAKSVLNRVIARPDAQGRLVGTPTPTTDWGEVKKVFNKVANHVPCPEVPLLEHVPLLWASPTKRRVYERAAYEVHLRDVTLEDSFVKKAFVKPEKHNGDTIPRVISPRSPRYNVCVAQYLKTSEKLIYDGLDKVAGSGVGRGLPVVCKSMNNTQRGTTIAAHFAAHPDCVAVGLDASRFDQHVGVGALRAEHYLYNKIHRSDRLAWLLDMQLDTPVMICCPDGKLEWKRKGGRMSGDMNTSLGNVSLSVAMLVALRDRLGNDMTFINDGDDCVCFMSRRHLAKFLARVKGFFLEHGFTMKVEEPVDYMEGIEFCQSKPVSVGGSWIMVRDPRKVVRQDYLATNEHSATESQYLRWAYSVGICGLMSNAGVPVLQAFYSAGVENGIKVKDPKRYHGDYGYLARCAQERRQAIAVAIEDTTRLSFYKAFGIDATEQRELEGIFYRFPTANERVQPALSQLFATK